MFSNHFVALLRGCLLSELKSVLGKSPFVTLKLVLGGYFYCVSHSECPLSEVTLYSLLLSKLLQKM